jgi:glycosyltransferase involved in cell wall biosynthesis
MPAEQSLPVVSVLATCFNHERYVVECLESIHAQTYPNVQLIVADDASTDGSVRAIRDWVERTGTPCTLVLHEENRGICRTRNEALAHARGAYVSGISTDDVWLPDKLADQVAQLEALPQSVGVAYCDAARIDEDGNPLPETFVEHLGVGPPPEGDLYETLLTRNFLPAGSTLVRRECYAAVGPFDESLPYEDRDMWLRIARRYAFVFTPRVGVRYRVHPVSLSHVLTDEQWWAAELAISLKHLGHSPAWDAVLWDRIARAAYRLGRPEQLEYARANLGANRNFPALVLYGLCRAHLSYDRVRPVRRFLNWVGTNLREARYAPRARRSPTPTSL